MTEERAFALHCDQGWVYLLDTRTGALARHHMGNEWKDSGSGWQAAGDLREKTSVAGGWGPVGRFEMRCDQGWVYVLDTRSGELSRHAMGAGWRNVGGSPWRQVMDPAPESRGR